MKRHFFVIATLVVIFAMIVVGCGTTQESKTGNVTGNKDKSDLAKTRVKVGLLMDGPINDQGWNASAYSGLKQIESELGAEIAYSESVALSDVEEQVRSYASEGYDIVISHGYVFIDGVMKVAPEFPDTKFILTSCDVFQEPNVGSVTDDGLLKGFLGGVVAAAITESNHVGFLGGAEIPPIIAGKEGFEAGAKYVKPDVKVVTVLTGSFTDAGKAKETAISMRGKGLDVLMVQADMAGIGAIEAAEEMGVEVIGVNTDQNELAPNTIVTSSMADFSIAMTKTVKDIMEGTWTPKANIMGLKEGVVCLAPYHGFEDKISKEAKDKIEEVQQEIIEGIIDPKALVEKLVR